MELLRVAIIIPLLEDRFNKNKKDFYMKWENLNTQNRAELIKLYVRNGVTSLDKMKEHYNSFNGLGTTYAEDGEKGGDGGHLFDDGGLLGKIKSLFAENYYDATFNEAYSRAVKNGVDYFKWNGNRYSTKNSGKKRKPTSSTPDYSQYSFSQAYRKANKELPLNSEFGWKGNVFSANNSKETSDLEKMPTYKLWETVTGKPWSKAKEWGITDGQAKTNIGLHRALLEVSKNKLVQKDFSNADKTIVTLAAVDQVNRNERQLYSFNVPENENPIQLNDKNAGKNRFMKVFPTVLDSIATHGLNTNTNPIISFGLPLQESTMLGSSGEYVNQYKFNAHENGLNPYNPLYLMYNPHTANTSPLISLFGTISRGNADTKDEIIKRGAPYAFKKYADFIEPSNIMDWANDFFKTGNYNPNKKKEHTSSVLQRGRDFVKAKEVQDWFYNHWLPGQNNQQEWLDWWNSGANYANGGHLYKDGGSPLDYSTNLKLKI